MKVLLRRNVSRLGQIGDVVDVKPGYARNYLLPSRLGVTPTEANLKAIEADKQRYLETVAKERAEVEARAALVHGKEVTIAARATEEGHLYGSVGPAQIAAAMVAEGSFIEADDIALDEPIHQLDKYDVRVKFAHDVTATIHVWVVPLREAEGEEGDAPAGETAAGDDSPAPDKD